MVVLHISGARSWGGNEQQLADILPELEKLGVENIVLGIVESPLHISLKKSGVTFLKSKEPKIHRKKNFKYLKDIIIQYNIDVIHLHTSDSVTLFTVSDLLFNLQTPAVLSKKGIGNSMSYLSLYKYNYKNIKRILCVSKAVKADLAKNVIKNKNHHKLKVIYDGVNLDRTTSIRKENLRDLFSISKDCLILGNIANHTTAKDLEVLINMVNYMVKELDFKQIHLVQLGEFSRLTDSLQKKIDDLELNSFISLGGFQDHALDFMTQFDCYVMSSQREGLPITIFEAFYKKTPVVSTKAGGIPEAITDGENGYLAEIKDYKTLGQKVKTLLNDPELQQQFVKKSESIFYSRFVASNTALETFSEYQSLIK